MCRGKTDTILYVWALDAPKMDLPNGVGFQVGKGTGRKYLVIQIHYKNLDIDFDTTGVQVESPVS